MRGTHRGNDASKSQLEKNMEESKERREQEQQSKVIYNKYCFLLDRLTADIRFFFHSLHEFVDPPGGPGQEGAWSSHIAAMETKIKGLTSNSKSKAVEDSSFVNVETVVCMLNFRDWLMTTMLNGILYQKAVHEAVLDEDSDEELDIDDTPMANLSRATMEEMTEKVATYTQKGAVPEKFVIREFPSLSEPGTFTYDKSRQNDRGSVNPTAAHSVLENRILTVARQMQLLDKHLRHITFGAQILIPDKHKNQGRSIASDEIRKEITKWFDKCSRWEHELQQSKALRHTPWEQQLEQLNKHCAEKDVSNKLVMSRVHRLETDLRNLDGELMNIRREKGELEEKNYKMEQDTSPALDRTDKLLSESREAMDQLTADAEMLSQMFKLQVEENRKSVEERDELSKELIKFRRQLKSEKVKNQFKEEELQKKETLYQRTVDARKATHETYIAHKAKILEVEEQMKQREADWQQMLNVVADRDAEIRRLKQELRRAHQSIDELEQEKSACMQEFKKATGQPYRMLLEQFRAA